MIPEPIPLSEPVLEANAWAYVKDALDSGWVSSVGAYVDKFEQLFAGYFDVPATVATVNGTAALHIALKLAGVQAGDEVIVPSLTFISSINVIRYLGAIPVFWDSSPQHWNADPELLPSLLTPRSKAVMAVHLYGTPMQMQDLLNFTRQHGLALVEDTAEALGATWQGELCGRLGDFGCLSFNGNKTLTTGGGGLILSRDRTRIERARYLINQAKDDPLRFVHHEVGFNYRLSNLQAALGVAQFESLPRFLERRRAISDRYQQAFADHPALTCFYPPAGAVSSAWLYGLALNPERLPDKTSMDMVQALGEQGIQARPFFMPGHCQRPFKAFATRPLPLAERWHRLGFNLPSSSSLQPADQERVIAAVQKILDHWSQSG